MPDVNTARLAIRNYLESNKPFTNVSEPVDFRFLLAKLSDHPRKDQEQFFIEELSCEDPFEAVISASILLENFGQTDRSHLAIGVLRLALQSDNKDLIEYVIWHLGRMATVPADLEGVVSTIFQLHGAENANISGIAMKFVNLRPTAVQNLYKQLINGDPVNRYLAAIACCQNGLHLEKAWNYLMIAIATTEDRNALLQNIMAGLSSTVTYWEPAEICFIEVCEQPELDEQTRRMALLVLARMGIGSERTYRHLLKKLNDHDFTVFLSAAEGLHLRPSGCPSEAIDLIVGRLKDKRRKIRISAANLLLQCDYALSREHLRLISRRLCKERDVVILEKVGAVLAKFGDVSIPYLLHVTKHMNGFRWLIAYWAISASGQKGRDMLFRKMARHPNPRLSRLLACLLHDYQIGLNIQDAKLEQVIISGGRRRATDLMISLQNAGKQAAFLTPALLTAYTEGENWRAELASLVIQSIGDTSLAYFRSFEERLPNFRPLQLLREKLEGDRIINQRDNDLSWIEKREWIDRFVWIARVMEGRKKLSMREVERILIEEKDSLGVPDQLKASEGSLRLAVKNLEKALTSRWHRPVVLINNHGNKAGELTEDAKIFLRRTSSAAESRNR